MGRWFAEEEEALVALRKKLSHELASAPQFPGESLRLEVEECSSLSLKIFPPQNYLVVHLIFHSPVIPAEPATLNSLCYIPIVANFSIACSLHLCVSLYSLYACVSVSWLPACSSPVRLSVCFSPCLSMTLS